MGLWLVCKCKLSADFINLDVVDCEDLCEEYHSLEVQAALLPVAYNWKNIGGVFRIPPSKIRSIQSRDCKEGLREVVLSWLRKEYDVRRFGPPNWRWVVKAVAEDVGGSNPALAEKIARNHPLPCGVARDRQPQLHRPIAVVPSAAQRRVAEDAGGISREEESHLPPPSGIRSTWVPTPPTNQAGTRTHVGPYPASYDTTQSRRFPTPGRSTRPPNAQTTSSTYMEQGPHMTSSTATGNTYVNRSHGSQYTAGSDRVQSQRLPTPSGSTYYSSRPPITLATSDQSYGCQYTAGSDRVQSQQFPTPSGSTYYSSRPPISLATSDQSYGGQYTAGSDRVQSQWFPTPSGSTYYSSRPPTSLATSDQYYGGQYTAGSDRVQSQQFPTPGGSTYYSSRSPIAQATSSYVDVDPHTSSCTLYGPRYPIAQETTRTVVAREVSPPGATRSGYQDGDRVPKFDWFPSKDGKKERVRIETDGSNMVFTWYEPHLHTDYWLVVSLSCGDIIIDRQRSERVNPYKSGPPHTPHGIAVIINNETFDLHLPRKGSRIDECNLIQVFRYLRYRVEVYRDCTSMDIIRIFNGIKDRELEYSDSFVCCILSHGKQGIIYGCDSEKVELDELSKRLNAKSCKSLAGKPKLFFIQACRGSERDTTARIECDGGMIELPNEADFLFSYATPSGRASCRDPDHGSWYILELCRVLCRYATYLHLNDMLTMVHQQVSTREDNEKRQVPEITQRLLKNVYFL